MSVKVVYTLTENNELKIEYLANSDQDTIINLTNHSYFNLKGASSGTIADHVLQINADRFTPVKDSGAIPTGELKSVKNTPFDFTAPTKIGERINDENEQLNVAAENPKIVNEMAAIMKNQHVESAIWYDTSK